MTTRTTLTEKGQHNGWTIYKHEGIPGLAMPDPTYWAARKGEKKFVADTRKDVIRNADLHDATTPEDLAHTDRIAAMLLPR